MIATVVTPSINGAQVLALLAAFGFIICTGWALFTKAFYSALLAFGLFLLALSALWGWAAAFTPH
jgi:hypothetical protein